MHPSETVVENSMLKVIPYRNAGNATKALLRLNVEYCGKFRSAKVKSNIKLKNVSVNSTPFST